jgi:hypothetical protein
MPPLVAEAQPVEHEHEHDFPKSESGSNEYGRARGCITHR